PFIFTGLLMRILIINNCCKKKGWVNTLFNRNGYRLMVFVFIVSPAWVLSQSKTKLRELSPDRPHQTESPITVDKWHIMFEADLINFAKKNIDNEPLNTLGVGYGNLKFGFHKRMDIEVISGICSKDIYKNTSLPTKTNYLSDFTFRYKLNILGNDSGDLAIAIMPIIRTTNFFNQKGEILNGGILINAEREIAGKFGLGYTGGLSSFSFKPYMKQYEIFSTLSFDYKLAGHFRSFVEGSYRYNQSAEFLHTYSFDAGVTFTPLPNLQFDGGFYFYMPANSPFIFIGGTIRI
ncbi:MAG: hypothetical protein JWO32_2678, partial [Bacteroidetes bacterium]|nr:hypothetical protein [Bacteroidota bacterium]